MAIILYLVEFRFCYDHLFAILVIKFVFCMLKVLLLESMFGGVFSVPVNNLHLRKSGSRLIIANLGKALSLWILEKLALNLRETNCKMV